MWPWTKVENRVNASMAQMADAIRSLKQSVYDARQWADRIAAQEAAIIKLQKRIDVLERHVADYADEMLAEGRIDEDVAALMKAGKWN